ncbi:MAG TPA: PilZ domain-containing protein [Thermoanaerobaculia bacterium]|jgi:hypothetical protein|nr:PilZ domain-containing protein [Thermoanaerobaculia bacterium]
MTAFPRKKKRLLVEFTDEAGVKHTAFTRDVSLTGLFVVSESSPPVGQVATLVVHFPRGVVTLSGRVARQGRASSAALGAVVGGFAFELAAPSDELARMIALIPV